MYFRYLNTIETVMANSHAMYVGTSQTVTLLHLDKKISTQLLQQTFEQYCEANPILLAKLTIQNKKWCLQKCSHAKINYEVVKFDEELTNFDVILENEVNLILDHTKTLTKLKLVYLTKNEGCLVILIQHHAIMDTYSAKKILSDVLKVFSEDDIELNYEQFPVWQAVEENTSVKNGGAAGNYGDNELTLALKSICTSEPKLRTSVNSWVIDSEQIAFLANYAKNLDSTLNSLLTTLLSMGVMEVLNIHQIETYSAITYRKKSEPYENLGCLLDVVGINIKSWDIDDSVRHFEREINYIKHRIDGVVEKVSQIASESKRHTLSSQKAIALCTGLGFTNSGRTDRLTLNNGIDILAYRSVANRTSNALLFTFHMSFHKGNLIISAISSQLVLDKATILLFIERINKYITIIEQRERNNTASF